jgi:hypothetical protein
MDISQELWNELWTKSRGGVYQSGFFNKIYGNNKKSVTLTIAKDGALLGGLIAYEKSIKTPIGTKKILEAHGTPLYTEDAVGHELLQKFKQECKNYLYGTIAPTVLSNQSLFIEQDYNKVSNHTVILNLNFTEEELHVKLEKKSIRWGIKTAQKSKLTFALVKDETEIKNFLKLYKKTALQGDFAPESVEFIKSMAYTEMSKLFLVYHKKTLVAGGLVLLDFNNSIATLSLTASSSQGLKLQAMPFLYWNMILHSKSLGMKIFDLGGYDKTARPGEKLYNINKFKERFGGEIVEQTVFSTNSVYPLLRKTLAKLRFIKKLYKKSN